MLRGGTAEEGVGTDPTGVVTEDEVVTEGLTGEVSWDEVAILLATLAV